jgi:hypothetical protein
MTILTEEQFQEFIEENPEMEQCYDLSDEGMDARYDANRIYWN